MFHIILQSGQCRQITVSMELLYLSCRSLRLLISADKQLRGSAYARLASTQRA